MKTTDKKSEMGGPAKYVSKWNAEVEHPIRWLPLGLTLEEKIERIEMLHDHIQVYRIWKMARRSVPTPDREFFDREVERLEAFLKSAL